MLKYEKAVKFAANAHDGQIRKGDKSPYITHPLTVAITLLDQGCDEDIVQAAILHDTVEDTRVTLQDIADVFGDNIMRLVKGVSEPDKSLPWRERKEHTIEYLKTAPLDERLIVSADKLHNISSMVEQYQREGDDIWQAFNGKKDEQIWYYSQVVSVLKSHADFPSDITILTDLEKKVDEFVRLVS